jgi:peptide/nickel transport system permease protein
MRIMRANFLDTMRAEFVMAARAKGVPELRVLFIHTLRNAINPLVTIFGYSIAGLLSGSLIVEIVMGYPGIGLLVYEAFFQKDIYVVMASILMASLMLVLGNLIGDISLALVDPRIRLEK